MRRAAALLGLIPLLGLTELALHCFFAARAPDGAEYAALGAELARLKQPGQPLVVAPDWAEPWVRQAAPGLFPLNELARADDASFASFLEVSLLGQSAPELDGFPFRDERAVGAFRVRRRQNPRYEPTRYDFVAAVDEGRAEVFTELDARRSECVFGERPRTETGGLHGHVAYPRRRHQCALGRFVGVTLIDDQDYRPRRCILAQPPESGSVVLRFAAVPAAARLVGFVGASYFLERDATRPQIELTLAANQRPLARRTFSGAEGWTRFDTPLGSEPADVEVHISALARGRADFCFSLEAK